MRGAILGDIVGSTFQGARTRRSLHLPVAVRGNARVTAASHLVLAAASHVLTGEALTSALRARFREHPYAGWGWRFMQWAAAESPAPPYGSLGCGAALRAVPVAWAASSLDLALAAAERGAAATHQHPEGLRAARALAAAVHLALVQPGSRGQRERLDTVRDSVAALSGYDLDVPLGRVPALFACDGTGPGALPPALIAALTADGFEDALHRAVAFGGRTAALTALTGALAEALFGLPEALWAQAAPALDEADRALVSAFEARHPGPRAR